MVFSCFVENRQFVERRMANSLAAKRRQVRMSRPVFLLTEHFSYDEDEYGSANAPAQEQIQQ
jgi:hypothetical protein